MLGISHITAPSYSMTVMGIGISFKGWRKELGV